ncbi:DsbA family protein [Helicobacter cynogastricus]|uniref:DsbA family protein n=1 Tax=Helicobacter cynogastricus TaxID=329937 RepID=UPI0013159699|nr:disulfide isomerase [Helicobacter cynogastricus]
MRKIVYAMCVCAGLLSAKGVGDNVVNLIRQQTKKEVRVLETLPLKSDKDFQVVVVEDPETKYHIPLLANKDGSMVLGLGSVFFSKDNQDIALLNGVYHKTSSHNFKQANGAKLNALFSGLPKDYVINLVSKNKNAKNLYIVSDPRCPHCQNELRHVHERLKDANVHMVVVGLLGQKSTLKAADILTQIKQARTTEDKIAMLEKIYATNYEPGEVSDDKIQEVEKTTKKILATGIESVPFIYEYQ